MGTKVRHWRLRDNPLRRRSDIAEGWAVLATGVLLATAAPAVGVAAAWAAEDAALRQARDRYRTVAVLAEAAPETSYTEGRHVLAAVRWTASDGSSRTGRTLVRAGSEAGSRTAVWLDDRGTVQPPPATPGQAAAQGIVFGATAATAAAVLFVGAGWGVRVRLDRRREAQWEREWAEVGPQWRHRRA
jgi:hypothetical protein